MATSTKIRQVDDGSFEAEVLASELPVMVDFGATWCAPCRALLPVVERVATERAGQVKVVTMDTDDSPETAKRYGVRGVPTVMVFKKGETTATHLGVTTKERLLELLER